jgi:SAM-dependent methyltransferase
LPEPEPLSKKAHPRTGPAALPAPPPEESFVPGRPPDPSIQRVGPANLCPGCGSDAVRTLCRGGDLLYATTERTFLVLECQECRMVRLYPRPEPAEMRRFYPDPVPPDGSGRLPMLIEAFLQRLMKRDNVRFLRQTLRKVEWDGPVLDVGCGDGRLLRELNLPPGRIVGMNFSVDAAAVAWGWNAVPAVCAALPAAPFPDGLFAVISMFQVLEHLYDPLVYIEAAARLLHPGGRLILQVPNAGSWQFLLFGERWSGLDIPRHLLLFHESDLVNLLDFSGFEIVRRRRFSLWDDAAMFATSLAPQLHPEVRRQRGTDDNAAAAILRHAGFAALWLLALPFALIEGACRGGATITVEARRKREA